MTHAPLSGLTILVVEDDYYLATDTRTVLEEAGGHVLGPFGTADDAIAALDGERADLAVIDINLGNGPVFSLARHLTSAKLPFLFATGYDQAVVPEDLKTIVRLEKPFRPGELINAAAGVYEATRAAAP